MREPIIGLEIHVELKTKSKMFCACPADHFGLEPNTIVCPVCLGLPGALPAANQTAIDWVVKAGLALGCEIQPKSKFDRKNYFYPDLPKGYQISQYDQPLCLKGIFEGVRIRRVHLEEDTAKLIHRGTETLIDFNRSGVALMEIVTEPDIRSSRQAKDFLKNLRQVIKALGISDCDLEKGSMRLEANISLRKAGEKNLPHYKVEVKNLNSFRFVGKAIDFEIERQSAMTQPIQETRGWDEKKQITYAQRTKEEAADYRYFPEPDLPPINLSAQAVEKLKREIPQLPDQQIGDLVKLGLTADQARIISQNSLKYAFFQATAVLLDHKDQINQAAKEIINNRVKIDQLSPAAYAQKLKTGQPKSTITAADLEIVINKTLANSSKAIEDYQKGKESALDFLLGQIMRELKGHGQADEIRALLSKKLGKRNV